ncbi:MAG: TonB-dependent receptor, partial [Saprospiraceae bacterium]|nr:TonB-dependent receptor [Saprospiraceae bacterium]
AEYGNAFSGVFDMRFRKGNLNSREYTFRAGLIGLDFSAEGPFKKGKSSYLVNFRYSTLGILNAFGLYVVRDNVQNNFWDLSFNTYFSSKDGKTKTTFFGVAGYSNEQWYVKDSADWVTSWDYVRNYNITNMGATGVTITRLLDDKSFLKVVVGGTANQIIDLQDDASMDSIRIETTDLINARATANIMYSRKLNKQLRLKAGLIAHAIFYKLDYALWINEAIGNHTFLDNNGVTFQTQHYLQANYRPSEKITLNFGFHSMFYGMNNDFTAGPRFAFKYQATPKTSITAAYGLHNRVLPVGTHLIAVRDSAGSIHQPNLDLKATTAHHAILGFEQLFGESLRFQIEFYYQHLFNVPVNADTNAIFETSTYYYYNMRDHYGTTRMVNDGEGRNFGADITLEKFFGKNFFVLFSGSLFSAMYKTSLSPTWRRSRMDSRWVTSFMATYEIPIKKGKGGIFQVGVKSFLNGGLRYTPALEAESLAAGFFIEDTDRAFEGEFGTYFRLDTRLAYRKSAKRFSYTIAIDLQNATNQQNIQVFQYDRQTGRLDPTYHAGILPVLSFQMDFK